MAGTDVKDTLYVDKRFLMQVDHQVFHNSFMRTVLG